MTNTRNNNHQITLSITEADYNTLADLAKRQDTSVAGYLNDLVHEKMNAERVESEIDALAKEWKLATAFVRAAYEDIIGDYNLYSDAISSAIRDGEIAPMTLDGNYYLVANLGNGNKAIRFVEGKFVSTSQDEADHVADEGLVVSL